MERKQECPVCRLAWKPEEVQVMQAALISHYSTIQVTIVQVRHAALISHYSTIQVTIVQVRQAALISHYSTIQVTAALKTICYIFY
jgi:hypothetical protein